MKPSHYRDAKGHCVSCEDQAWALSWGEFCGACIVVGIVVAFCVKTKCAPCCCVVGCLHRCCRALIRGVALRCCPRRRYSCWKWKWCRCQVAPVPAKNGKKTKGFVDYIRVKAKIIIGHGAVVL